jgi:hypothetical protein
VFDAADRPAWVGHLGPVRVLAEAEAAADGNIRQRWRLALIDGGTPPIVRLRACGRLDRPALAEITELQPLPPTSAQTQLAARDARLLLRAPSLPATATIDVSGVAATWSVAGTRAVLPIPWTAGQPQVTFEISGSMVAADRPRASRRVAAEPAIAAPTGVTRRPTRATSERMHVAGARHILESTLAYVRGCTALRTAPGERAILTDHRLLPLSWTRDAYYQALLLLAADGPGDRERVGDHLRWLWRRNERPDGRWVRSHHANGRRKDVAFQADQQLYPVLELADYWRATGDLPGGVDWAAAVPVAWGAAIAELSPALGLVATFENAADDPATAPYIAGSQVILWYAALRLAEIAGKADIGLERSWLATLAERVRTAFDRHLVRGGRWAYATDERGQIVHYHDANDLPIALAPAWGFCTPDDPRWLATMRFAFSPTNPGYWNGPMPGLGSVHTPGAWTLGDVQAWLFATLTADAGAASVAIARLNAIATQDGMLPEAYAVDDGGRVHRIRPWFAWPGAAFGAFWTLAEHGGLGERLAAAP